MSENLRKLVHDYTSAEKDSYMPKWPIISYSTEDEHVNYIGGQKITYWVNVPSAGTYSIFGNRTNGTYYDTTQNYKVKVDGKVAVASSLTYTFNEVGEHKITVKTKYSDLSLFRFKDEANGVATVAPITKIDLSHVNSSSANNTRCMFQNCNSLTSVGDLNNWDVSNVTNMKNMFYLCDKLEYVGNLSNWDTSKVTTMSTMFQNCYVLSCIGDLSNWCVSACTAMDYMFNKCYVLTSVGDLSNWDTSKVTTMSTMFQNCHSLTSVGDLSNWCTSACTAMDYMFCLCTLLEELDLSGWDTSKVTTMVEMFGNNSQPSVEYHLKTLKLGKWDVSKVATYDRMFLYVNSLRDIYLSSDSTSLEWIGARCVDASIQDNVTIHLGDVKYKYIDSAWTVVSE